MKLAMSTSPACRAPTHEDHGHLIVAQLLVGGHVSAHAVNINAELHHAQQADELQVVLARLPLDIAGLVAALGDAVGEAAVRGNMLRATPACETPSALCLAN